MQQPENPAAAKYALRLLEKGHALPDLARQMGLSVKEAREAIDWAIEERAAESKQEA